MITQHVPDRTTLNLLTAALLDYAPDVRWLVVRRGPNKGFALVLFTVETADALLARIAACVDAGAVAEAALLVETLMEADHA